jgi:hypothetical protein
MKYWTVVQEKKLSSRNNGKGEFTTNQLVCVDIVGLARTLMLSSSPFKAPYLHLLVYNELNCAIADTEQGEGSTPKQTRRSFFPENCTQAICSQKMNIESNGVLIQ